MRDCPHQTESSADTDACPYHLERLTLDLAQRESRLLGFWNHSPDLHCVFAVDGHILAASPSCFDRIGYAQTEMEGMPIHHFVHPDDIPSTLNLFFRMLSQHDAMKEYRARFRHAKGYYMVLDWNSSAPIDGVVYATARVIEEVLEPTTFFAPP